MKIKKITDLHNHDKNLHIIFYSIMIAGVIFSVLSIAASNGETLKALLFHDKTDTFMDFFNIVYSNVNFANSGFSLYPAFANMIFYCFGQFIPQEILISGAHAIRDSQSGMFVFGMYIAISSMVFGLIIYENKQGTFLNKILMVFCIFLSSPFIFLIERGNIIFGGIIFSALFIFGKDSKSKVVRELSYICLAIAAAIKIYPALLGFLLVKDKRFKDAVRCAVYGLILFLVPALVTYGFGYIANMITRYKNNVDVFNVSLGNKMSLTNITRLFFAFTNHYSPRIIKLANYLTIALLFAGTGLSFFFKSKWKSVAILCIVMIMIPNFNSLYSPLYMFIPLILFLNDVTPKKWPDYVYLLIFTAMFVPVAIGGTNFFPKIISKNPVSLSTVIRGASMLLMMLMLLTDGTKKMIETLKEKLIRKRN